MSLYICFVNVKIQEDNPLVWTAYMGSLNDVDSYLCDLYFVLARNANDDFFPHCWSISICDFDTRLFRLDGYIFANDVSMIRWINTFGVEKVLGAVDSDGDEFLLNNN